MQFMDAKKFCDINPIGRNIMYQLFFGLGIDAKRQSLSNRFERKWLKTLRICPCSGCVEKMAGQQETGGWSKLTPDFYELPGEYRVK